MYWNGGGNKAEWSAKPNKGVRAYCDNENWGGDDWGGDDWGGDDWGGDEHPTMEPSKHMFCFFFARVSCFKYPHNHTCILSSMLCVF